jgi:hypothetical protein
MPDSVLTPAPVKATTVLALQIKSAAFSTRSSMALPFSRSPQSLFAQDILI